MEAGNQELKTGTTTVGVITKEGIVLAADQQATLGNMGYDLESQKVYKITDNIALTNAGSVGDSLTIIRFLRSEAKLYETNRETAITAKALTTYLSNVLNANRYYPYSVQFIIGGKVKKSELFEITAFGGILERNEYATSGSGTALALSVLDQQYKKGMTLNQGIDLAIKAISASKKRDIYTGGKSFTVMVIDDKGTRKISESELKKFIPKK